MARGVLGWGRDRRKSWKALGYLRGLLARRRRALRERACNGLETWGICIRAHPGRFPPARELSWSRGVAPYSAGLTPGKAA